MFPRILDRVVEWVKTHMQFGLEFEDHGSRTWVFVRTWRRDSFYRVAVGVIDRYHGYPWASFVRSWQWGVFGVNFWGATHSCGMLQRISGERVHSRSIGLSNL